MENKETDDLLRLLRAELTAVHQQFVHMLALRQWQRGELLDRITAIDTVDFKNAMQIIDSLVSRGNPVSLPSHSFRPGRDVTSILFSEMQMEQHLSRVIETLDITGEAARAYVDKAAAPRGTYRDWLNAEIAKLGPRDRGEDTTPPSLASFIAELIALVEQPMLHAFKLWHSGQNAEADNAWRLSGAAMLYGTAIIKRAALSGDMPAPAVSPAVQMQEDRTTAFEADMALVQSCADIGRKAADASGDTAMRRVCSKIAEDCDIILDMEPDGEFPATFGRSPVFESFSATREKHLQ
jgi:bacterioferritin (cytochrome b1)